ncbi:hypothetical protein SARC_09580 [Sphaeroforma arctica JP610]|uniref:UspA domain-containing protein n=1 Tax=Sphaeroforma arctica JP610 TaxID=667725 RepID=A0A0L0FMH2_9EUKA|nr:hypothetical protein SARC_09580 [Sphaeroforma arctica JP610]KNC77969.1 hypothetical protein SARC_09580 [Sphaeroforma arctica JP610]|eukprot:XP_014151871.1 hypothetical protein SARC_09580 [Sphaeroforma arctica JP610]
MYFLFYFSFKPSLNTVLDLSLYAIQWSKTNFLRVGDQVSVLWVLPDYTDIEMDDNGVMTVPGDCAKSTKEKVDMANTKMKQVKEDFEQLGYEPELYVESGDARGFIPLYADKLNADTVVMGNRGNSGFRKMLLGSVSDHCVHECKCPVLIVRRKGDTES